MSSAPSRTVVVTGSAGRLGRAACRELLARGWHVRAVDRCPSPAGESIVADLADAAAVAAVLRGADALVHLAATPDDDDFASRLLPDNLLGLHNVIEGARAANLPRVILASSGQVNFIQQEEGPWPIRVADPKLMARVGEAFPLQCPACGGDIRLISFITEPGPIRKILTHLGEPLEPPPISPARGPPTDWGELVQVHDDRDVFQAAPDELPAIDINSL